MGNEKKTKYNDMMLIGGLLIAALAAFLYLKVIKPHMAGTAGGRLILEISEDNNILYSETLNEIKAPFSFNVDCTGGGHNTFEVKKMPDGSIGVSCTEADCPDKICVETGTIALSDEMIVCLPHKVVARLYAPAG